MIYTAHNFDDLPVKIRKKWKNLDINIDIQKSWLKASEKAIDNLLPFYYVEESNDGEILNFIVANIIKKLDCLLFIQDCELEKKIIKKRTNNPNYFKYNVLFVGAPMGMNSGIFYQDRERFCEFFKQYKRYIFENLEIEGVFYTNTSVDDVLDPEKDAINFSYYPNTVLNLNFKNFNEYLYSLKKKKRWDVRNKIRVFQEKGCKIEIKLNSQITHEEYQTFYRLYRNTENNNPKSINYMHYSNFNAFNVLGDKYIWIILKQSDEIIAFALLCIDGSTLILKHVGLDYNTNRDTYAYFNLFYNAFNYGIRHNFKKILCGSTTYDVKRHLGCELIKRTATIIIFANSNQQSIKLIENLSLDGEE
ncbi:MAG: peptidogalycan biosysnthesis protein [Ligilactobacillus agilis]|nr:peptidogalycan biosysnthesis protein [Ligilactobacillus agilis]